MANVPADLKYTKSHEWVRVAGDVATVGITDHAQHELTDIVFVGDLFGSEHPAGGVLVTAATAGALDERRRAARVDRAESALRS